SRAPTVRLTFDGEIDARSPGIDRVFPLALAGRLLHGRPYLRMLLNLLNLPTNLLNALRLLVEQPNFTRLSMHNLMHNLLLNLSNSLSLSHLSHLRIRRLCLCKPLVGRRQTPLVVIVVGVPAL